jgi:hypothetical protein
MAAKTKGTVKEVASNGHALRSKDATVKAMWQPAERGPSGDGGIGNKAATALREIGDDASMKRVTSALDKVVTAVKSMSIAEQRVIGLALASDYTLESLIAKSRSNRVLGPRLGARDEARIAAIRSEKGEEAAKQFESMLLWSKGVTKKGK